MKVAYLENQSTTAMMDSNIPAFDKAGIKSTDMLTQGSSGIVFQKRVGKSSGDDLTEEGQRFAECQRRGSSSGDDLAEGVHTLRVL